MTEVDIKSLLMNVVNVEKQKLNYGNKGGNIYEKIW